MQEGSIRKRGKLPYEYNSFRSIGSSENGVDYGSSWKFPFLPFLVGLAVGFIFLAGIATLADLYLPSPVMLNEAATKSGVFNAERAFKHLERLTTLGPRVAGSYENEIRSVDLLLREVGFIKYFAHSIHQITIDVQKPTGVMIPVSRDHEHNILYNSLANVVVRIEAKNKTVNNQEALLVNAHFDSVFSSPGASDNGINVAVALEVLESLSRRSYPTNRPVIFLFNGAEEKGMVGAHGFITQHPWAKEIGAFVNLDACGAGGREIVFQAGPGNPWLIKAYADSAQHPFANIIGQEIFEARLIPSDTDFRIFRDFGKIPGLDLAYFKNGYVYHTKYDDVEHINMGTLQRAGDNLLALVSHLAELHWPTSRSFDDPIVFFDFLGVKMITLSNASWHILNLGLIALAFYQSITWVTARDSLVNPSSCAQGVVCKQVVFSCLAGIFQTLGAFFTVWIAVGVMTLTGRTMSWFSHPYLLVGLYGAPSLATALFISLKLSDAQQRALKSNFVVERVQFEGVKLNITLLVILSYMFGIRSNILLLLWLGAAVFGRWIMDKLYTNRDQDGVWFVLHYLSFLGPVLQTLYLSNSITSLLVPIAGRSGSDSNPDFLVAMVTAFLALLVTQFIFPLLSLIRNARRIILLLVICHLLSASGAIFTPLGFPYSASQSGTSLDVKPQRVQILHVERTFYESNGLVRRRESGYWLIGLDPHIKPELLAPLEPNDGVKLVEESQCYALPYCGLPYYFPSLKKIRTTYWAPAPQPLIYHQARIELVDQKLTGINTRNFTFALTGPDHMTLLIWPVQGVELLGWSASKQLPHADSFYKERPLYFVTYFYGVQPGSPYELTITLKVPPSLSGKPVVEIALTSHILHGHEAVANDFANALKNYPPWIYAHGWTATYSHWSF